MGFNSGFKGLIKRNFVHEGFRNSGNKLVRLIFINKKKTSEIFVHVPKSHGEC